MKTHLLTTLLTGMILGIIGLNSQGQSYTISNLTYDRATMSEIPVNTDLNFSFDYTKPAGDVFIVISPKFGPIPLTNYQGNTTVFRSENSGSVSTYFHLTSEGIVDVLVFKFMDAATYTELASIEVSTYFIWRIHTLNFLSMDPASPGIIGPEEEATLSLSYTTAGLPVTFQIMGRSAGNPYPIISNPPTVSDREGTVECSFHLISPGTIDLLIITMINAATSESLVIYNVNVTLTQKEFWVRSVTFNPPSPARVLPGNLIEATIDCSKRNDPMIISAIPMWNRQPIADGYILASGEVSGTRPTVSRYFYLAGEGSITEVSVSFFHPQNQTLLYEEIIPVSFEFVNYGFSNFILSPTSPVQLEANDPVIVTFDYKKPDGPVFIFAIPIFEGQPCAGETHSDSEVIMAHTGTQSRSFTVSHSGKADQIRVVFTNTSLARDVLYEQFIPVDITWSGSEGIRNIGTEENFIAFPNPCGPNLEIRLDAGANRLIRITTIDGKVLYSEQTPLTQLNISTEKWPSGILFLTVASEKGQTIKKIIHY